jgi:hypothetical protein
MPNLDPLINQNEATNKFENHLLSIKTELKKRIRPSIYPAYNKRHEKIIELIDWTLEKYKSAAVNIKDKHQQNEETIIIDNII